MSDTNKVKNSDSSNPLDNLAFNPSAKGPYMGLNQALCLLLALIPFTSWLFGGIERARRGKYLQCILWFIFPCYCAIGYIIDIIRILLKGDILVL